jgi:tetratricopeptide (TPR) repeat protein
MQHVWVFVFIVLLTFSGSAEAQKAGDARERARPHVLEAWKYMRAEEFPKAAGAFQQAIDIDPELEDAYCGLGLANVRLKKYGDAINLYSKCRDLYRAQAGKQFTNRQEAQRYRQDRLTEIDEIIRTYQTGPQTMQTQEALRQLQQQKRDIQDYISRSNNMTIENSVPGFVYVALGSAYFRSSHLEEAEREYKNAIAADPKSGQAFNNLAALYFQTGRYREASEAVKSAEKNGFTVHPQLKEDIKSKLK